MRSAVIIYGFHSLKAALTHQPQQITSLFLLKGREDERSRELAELAASSGVAVQRADRQTLDRLSEDGVHQGFLAKLKAITSQTEADLLQKVEQIKQPFLIVLEGIQDPHNLGAILRTAAAAGVDGVVISRQDRVGLTGAVSKVSSGTVFTVPIYEVPNLVRALNALKKQGVWLVGTALSDQAQSLYALDLRGPLAMVMGSEGKGLKQLTVQTCDYLANIPMNTEVGSLNVSVSAGICLFEALRQRQGLSSADRS